ncbi:hypothetical protein JHJ32_22250 [Parapedobacter sp. ISTM3]|uniref:hypothetical protein n=1 Tax=Parapedobacter sp. ISTM3 TaxID=2800130 RepID=UPI001907FA53|nr:hypothetical protein [Parapedobacter sp. ISTM3]MBK1442738.1 hypothetical protein [Parapedobacter sp. ISTM3]
MKINFKYCYMLLLVCIAFDGWCQNLGKKVVIGSEGGHPEFYVASLPKSSSLVFEKLKIQVFGGYWTNIDLGETTYYITTRGGLRINQERHGGSTSRYALQVYDNGSSYDFVIKVVSSYPSFFIRAWKIAGRGVSGIQELSISDYNSTGKTEITSQIPINKIFITSQEGNIGLGADPDGDYRLSVNGKVRAKEVKVEVANWPDYVFKTDYPLMPLAELEAYIKTNGHLPGIPAAEEVEAVGVGLAEMNHKLLEKVEELTLHLIERQKAEQALKQQYEGLRADHERLKEQLGKLMAPNLQRQIRRNGRRSK